MPITTVETEQTNKTSFGSTFLKHMYLQKYRHNLGWHDGGIVEYQALNLMPSAAVFHYGQAIFEGMKAYRNKNGKVYLFRPTDNLRRFNHSANRLAMPELDITQHLQQLVSLIAFQRNEIPVGKDASLYIRPTMIATEESLNVKSSASYLHFIITSPVNSYFASDGIDVLVSDEHFRAVPGGVGNVKTAGNYAPSYLVSNKAQQLGCSQVLWLDPKTGQNIEEIGAMNIFIVYADGTIATPALSGSILPGITRDSVIQLCDKYLLPVLEQTITITELIEAIKLGQVVEIFGTGTAASITPIDALVYLGQRYAILNKPDKSVIAELKELLTGIQYGELDDPFEWRVEI